MIVRDKHNTLTLLFAWHGTIFPKVFPTMLGLSLMSVVLALVAHYNLLDIPTLPPLGFTVFGVVLSIFLAFRNNASYDRWWEGRKLWGTLIATERHLIRDSQIFSETQRLRLLKQVILFTRLLRDRLRHETAHPHSFFDGSGEGERSQYLHFQEHINPPQLALEQLQNDLVAALKNGEISDIVYASLTAHITTLGNVQAGCDRIASTPLPFAYSVLLHRAIYSFCFMLPFAMDAVLGLWTPLMVAWLVYMFLGLDALGAQIEEPFGTQENDLPLDSIVRLVEREILIALGKPLPPILQADKFNLS